MNVSIAPEHLSAAHEAELFSPVRFPVLGNAGRDMLRRLVTHPHAPTFHDHSGHRLTRTLLMEAQARHSQLQRAAMPARHDARDAPEWAESWVRQLAATVPAHAGLNGPMPAWQRLPTTSRADFSARLSHHLPRGLPLDRLLCFSTSGTTGHPLKVPSLPEVAADYQAFHDRALAHFGLHRRAGEGDVGIVLAGFQQRCFTYVSVNPLHGECGLVKLNLNPVDWRDPADRARYLDALAPELISGDPLSLAELATLGLQHRPRAMLSTSMALHHGLREQLQERFACPVLDLYSMNEVGPIGVFDPALEGFMLLQPHLHVEVVDAAGLPLPWGETGEVTVSRGFNPCLPLLRYRTGDFARLERSAHGPVLRGLQGRAPVRFQRADGGWVNNVEITKALASMPLVRFALHQRANGRLCLRVDSRTPLALITPDLRAALESRLGPGLKLDIEPLVADDKLRQYTSDLDGAPPTC